jgi:hypothetical protein
MVAIAFIFLGTTLAWLILGATIGARTGASASALRGKVASTWGAPHQQKAPSAVSGGSHLDLERSRVNVDLNLNHRQKGLLWYSTYSVAFTGVYTFRNSTAEDRDVTFTLPFPVEKAMYDNLVMTVNGHSAQVTVDSAAASTKAKVAAGHTATFQTHYLSQGLDSWRYDFGGPISGVNDFLLTMTTNFKDIDFPENNLSPTGKKETPAGWELQWKYQNLISGFQIAMQMPEKLQPGPLAGEISYFAPVSLFFFFFLMLMITSMRGIDLHPMNYFFLAAAFFSFHLLLAYLVDHISIHAAFFICSMVSIFLVVSYLRLVVGIRFAAMEAAGVQFVYLVLFSYAFFFKGLTGLTVTIGSILTLFAVMQMTGGIRWSEKFTRPSLQ